MIASILYKNPTKIKVNTHSFFFQEIINALELSYPVSIPVFCVSRINTIIIDIHPDVIYKVFHKDIEGLTSNDVEY